VLYIAVVAMAGVSVINPEKFIDTLSDVVPYWTKFVLAFDMDWEINEDVKDALSKLLDVVIRKYWDKFVLTWDRSLGKGMDDVLLKFLSEEIPAENLFTYVKAEEFQAKFLSEKTENVEVTASEQTKDSIEIDEQETGDSIDDSAPENMSLREEPTAQENINTFSLICRDFLDLVNLAIDSNAINACRNIDDLKRIINAQISEGL
jgi:hypothetical protein